MRTSKRITGLALALPLLFAAGCTVGDLTPKAEKALPQKIVATMKAKGMTKSSPVMLRIFKEEGMLEVWKQKDTGRYDLVTAYNICKVSGRLGPKFMENDRQAPEGFYTVRPAQMNPKSSYHLSFNIGYPNAYDQAHGRTGAHLMVHGACSSSGCYSMTDEQVEEIFAFARDSFRGGQTEFQIQAFPFRMTAENMARYRGDPNYAFWENLKEGYDHFQIAKVPPKVDVCEKRYVFNVQAPEGQRFTPAGSCPQMSQPENLKTAYESNKSKNAAVFNKVAASSSASKRAPSIKGPQEAAVIAAWQKKRVQGQPVGNTPPYLPETAVAAAPASPAPDQAAVASIDAQRAETQAAAAPAPVQDQATPETATAGQPAATSTVAFPPPPPAPAPAAQAPQSATSTQAEQPAAAAQQQVLAPAAPAAKKQWWKLIGG